MEQGKEADTRLMLTEHAPDAPPPAGTGLEADIRRVLADHARLPVDVGTLHPGDDLFQAGMSSHASVNVMLALEDTFDLEFPDEMLKRSVFASIAAMAAAIADLQGQAG